MKDLEYTLEYILEHWRHGNSILDWRPLTIKGKREWLKACLLWTGLPDTKIGSFDFILDGNQVSSDLDFYCLLGETFFGYRGYFGQDSHGLQDCLAEISSKTKGNAVAQRGARLKVRNSGLIEVVLKDDFQYIVRSFRERGV